MATTDRAAVGHFLGMPDRIDLAIPRGGESLIRRVVAEAKMPVLKHYTGNCHVYVDADADLRDGRADRRQRQGPAAGGLQRGRNPAGPSRGRPELPADGGRRPGAKPGSSSGATTPPGPSSRRCRAAEPSDWDTEYLDLILAVGVVDSIERGDRPHHPPRVGAHRGDRDPDLIAARRFVAEVDSSAVVVNASTRFNDGGQLGLGAEIGISTDKYHARGPCGLRELTSTKWIVFGEGQIRE